MQNMEVFKSETANHGLQAAEGHRLLILIGQRLTSLPDHENLLQSAVSYLRNDLSYTDARIEVFPEPRTPRLESGCLFPLEPTAQVVVPVQLDDDTLGEIIVPLRGRNVLSDLQRDALKTFASFLAVGLRNVQRLEEFRTLASTDALTGVPNRRKLFELGPEQMRYARATGLIVFDIDWLKRINDDFGHLAGDALLKSVAHRAKACTRKTDTLARFGGDEFVILLPNTGLAAVRRVAERVRAYVEGTYVEWNGRSIRSTISVGAACVEEEVDFHSLLNGADRALLAAKRAGRNAVHVMDAAKFLEALRYNADREAAETYRQDSQQSP
jgi:diguanylate cyclase (GGDEF)-like protein